MGDRARRNNLVLNSLCEERWIAHCQDLHRERLQHMKHLVDTSEPPSVKMSHLNAHANPKKLEQKAERQKNIDKDNRVLLEKMLKIHSTDSTAVIRPFLARTTFRLQHGNYVDPISGSRCVDHINPTVCPSLYSTASTAASLYCPSPTSWHTHSASSTRPGTPLRPHSSGSAVEAAMLLRAMNPGSASGSASGIDTHVHGANHEIHLASLHGPGGPGAPYLYPPSRAHGLVKRAMSCRSLRGSSSQQLPVDAYTSAPSSPMHRTACTAPSSPAHRNACTAPSSPGGPRRYSAAPYSQAAVQGGKLPPSPLSPLSNRPSSGISCAMIGASEADQQLRAACRSPRGSAGTATTPSRLSESTGAADDGGF